MSEIKLPPTNFDHYTWATKSHAEVNAMFRDYARAAVEQDRAGRDAAEKELTHLRTLVSRIVSEADTNPFNPIGHAVEHVIPELRNHITPQPECEHCGGFGEVTGESPGFACPACNGTGETCTGTIGSVPELFDCGNCNGTGKSAKPAEQQAQRRPLTEHIDEVMSQAQVFASAWALVDTRFDDGSMMETAEQEKAALRAMLEQHHGIGEQAQEKNNV